MRISSAQCCNSPTCSEIGTCDDVFLSLCLRNPNTVTVDRQSCLHFIAGYGINITNRQLTPADIVRGSVRYLSHPIRVASIIHHTSLTVGTYRNYKDINTISSKMLIQCFQSIVMHHAFREAFRYTLEYSLYQISHDFHSQTS